MKRCKVILIIILLYLFSSCAKENKILVDIKGNTNITVQEFTSFYNRKYNKNIHTASHKELKELLDQMIAEKIKLKTAYRMGLDQDSSLIKEVKKLKETVMLQTIHKLKIIDEIINEERLRDFYHRSSREVEYQDIVIKGSTEPEADIETEKKAEMILQELRSGNDFGQVAKKYSQDPDIYLTKKSLSYTNINDDFQNTIYSLREGQISDVIKKFNNFHIVKINNIHQKDTESFSNKRDEIQRKLWSQLRVEISKETQKYLNTLIQNMNINWNEKNLNILCERLNTISSRTQLVKIIQDTLQGLPDNDKQKDLLVFEGEKFTVSDLIKELSFYRPRTRFNVSDVERLKEQIIFLMKKNLFLKQAYNFNIDKYDDVVQKVTSFKNRMLLRNLNKSGLFTPEEPTEEEVYNYYKENRNDIYERFKDKKFENIKHYIEKDLKIKLSEEKKEKWLAKKREEYKVRVFDDVLKEITDEEQI